MNVSSPTKEGGRKGGWGGGLDSSIMYKKADNKIQFGKFIELKYGKFRKHATHYQSVVAKVLNILQQTQ